ncbi:DUF2219 family protein [bacterium]|nr:DUF2219 family protein [bacterium]
MRLIGFVSFSLIALASLAFFCDSARSEAREELGTFNFVLENDLFADLDRHYTNGIRFSWLSSENQVPAFILNGANYIPIFPQETDIRVEYALGQSMFTPRDITIHNPPPEDRPYAGYLYGSVGLISDNGKRLDKLQLSLGLVGPESFAEQAQEFVHDIQDADDPHGWDTQLPNEPTFQFNYRRSWWAAASTEFWGLKTDLTPHIGAALGSVYVYADTGFVIRLGQNLPRDYGPPRIMPSLPGSGFFIPQQGLGWYVFGGLSGRGVAHNIFLDGTVFNACRSVEKEPLVGEAQTGWALTYNNFRFAYTHVFRTQEFETQDEADFFGALSISYRF